MKVTKVKKVKTPEYGTIGSAGLDLFVPDDFSEITIFPGENIVIPAGLKLIIPKGYCGVMMNKSSIGSKGIIVGAELIDSDYRGEISIDIHNISTSWFTVRPGMKLSQLVLMPCFQKLDMITNDEYEKNKTNRGEGGFGSTGGH